MNKYNFSYSLKNRKYSFFSFLFSLEHYMIIIKKTDCYHICLKSKVYV